jgi:DNA-binding NarL/FixJ family response regulator
MSDAVPIRLLIVDDHPPMREGLAALLERQGSFQAVALAANGQEAIEQYRIHQPDVVLMDVQMPVMEGAAATAALCQEFPQARILMLTTYEGDEDIYQALRAGALGYLLKGAPSEELFEAIRTVRDGRKYLTSSVVINLVERPLGLELSDREMKVLQLMVQGKSNREIGKALAVTEGTVKFHVSNIFQKLGAKDRVQAVTIALKRGLVRL